MKTTVEALQCIALFATLSDAALEHVARAAIRRAYAPGEMILLEGAPCQAAYFIAEGEVRIYRISSAGREQVLTRLGPGEGFNTVPIFQEGSLNHASVQAVTSVVLFAIREEALRRLVVEIPELALAILGDFATRLDHLTNLVEDLSLRTVRGRLARFLLDNADRGGPLQQWTQEEIAAHLGTVRDMVGRALRAFADAQLVEIERQRITLLDREGLQAEAQL